MQERKTSYELQVTPTRERKHVLTKRSCYFKLRTLEFGTIGSHFGDWEITSIQDVISQSETVRIKQDKTCKKGKIIIQEL